MSNIIPFDSANLPAYLLANTDANVNDELGSGGGGFKVMGFKGKVWSVKENGEAKPIMRDGSPSPYIDVVVVKVWPLNKDNAKVYYAGKYVEGSDGKPDCYSNDGVKPSEYAADPQSSSCATCPHNQWGARITEDGKKAKVCQDSKRVAIAVPGHLGDPMLLRVPATSLQALRDLGAFATSRRTSYYKLLTRIGFDYTKAYPKLTFQGLGYLDETSVAAVEELRESNAVAEICGITENAPPSDDMPTISATEQFQQPAPEPKADKKAAPKAEPKSKAKAAIEGLVADMEAAPKAAVKVEAPAPKAEAVVVEVDDMDGLEDAIGDLLGDDD